MKNLMFLLFTLAFTDIFAQQEIDRTISFGGLAREYHLYIPDIYHGNVAVPLLFNLHGMGSNNLQQETYGYFNSIADTANFIICLPNGTLYDSVNRFWNAGFSTLVVDDVGFLNALIDSLYHKYNIDRTRIYFTGMSNGGFMAHTMACASSDRIAAAASVAGGMSVMQYGSCTPARLISVMEIHGDADNIVPYDGHIVTVYGINIDIVPVDTSMKFWTTHDGCSGPPNVTDVPNINTADGCTATRYDYNCNAGTSVVLYKITGGGHTWPGGFPIAVNGPTDADFNACTEIWKFLRQYKNLSSVLGISEALNNSNNVEIYPNPCNDYFHIRFNDNQDNFIYVLSDSNEKVIKKGNAVNNSCLNMQGLPEGLYILSVSFQNWTIHKKILKFNQR